MERPSKELRRFMERLYVKEIKGKLTDFISKTIAKGHGRSYRRMKELEDLGFIEVFRLDDGTVFGRTTYRWCIFFTDPEEEARMDHKENMLALGFVLFLELITVAAIFACIIAFEMRFGRLS